MSVTVIGGGSWATALIKILSEKNIKIKWWLRNIEAIKHIKKHHHNPEYLSSVELHPSKIKPYHNLKEALKGSEWVVLAIPAAFVEAALADVNPELFQGKKIISGVKGMVPSHNLLVTDWFSEKFNIPKGNFGAIAGPCHAEEIALEKQSYLTIASENIDTAKDFAELLACRFVKTAFIKDIDGVEYAAVMKNIVALACGITHGMGAGDNFQAVMVSNAMLEIERFVNKISPAEREINSSAYLGDLLVTAYSQFSRNRTFGNMIGRGYSVKTAQIELKMIAEGYYAVKSIHEINKHLGVKMPILDFTYGVLYKNQSLLKAFEKLKEQLI
ncbi:NAD(P)H-dependent glycerol-3-phosphate dehydrogenase [Lacihabitans sp. LS3-19]|uniref:NAD(P)H-dependent glycerol-3-phosphate dehydrogenase n=1 Tax=Lacihabitans sp. LS3-19 TaxID=2487335 RepID=UPI0020CF079F|nr:NAD(P)H-dependent glycerol-3-phosphate dehydrogenase [Lacihabitans sp. LS3-19]MCP9769199.1 NAD(P)H-dependent glycerol-3-phosphate dehydrogenase [Lacihabitans sp. LS3-19]